LIFENIWVHDDDEDDDDDDEDDDELGILIYNYKFYNIFLAVTINFHFLGVLGFWGFGVLGFRG
jgi:hypothetical protein